MDSGDHKGPPVLMAPESTEGTAQEDDREDQEINSQHRESGSDDELHDNGGAKEFDFVEAMFRKRLRGRTRMKRLEAVDLLCNLAGDFNFQRTREIETRFKAVTNKHRWRAHSCIFIDDGLRRY